MPHDTLTLDSINRDASRVSLSAGWCAYVEGRLPEALKHTTKAWDLDRSNTESLFQASKILMAQGKLNDALIPFMLAVRTDPEYVGKAVADSEFKAHSGQFNAFLDGMRDEIFKALKPQVQRLLTQAEGLAGTTCCPDSCSEIMGRWRSLLVGGWNLVDLLRYLGEFPADKQTYLEHVKQEKQRRRNVLELKKECVKVVREVEESYLVEEEYLDKVVVKPKSFVLTPEPKIVTKTRIIKKNHKVVKEVIEQKPVLVNGLGEVLDHFDFVRVPSGSFIMGSFPDEADRSVYETVHEVTFTKSFEIMSRPVTQALWMTVMDDNPSCHVGMDRPVENVSWNDIQQFLTRLNERLGSVSYRLPTEAEWEYSCRAGTTGASNGTLNHAGWNNGRGCCESHRVARMAPNAWGLYDMIGNVWEWCHDWYGKYPSKAVVDPQGPASGTCRVYRGGSWFGVERLCRSAFRGSHDPDYRYCYLGFRLARSCS
jgi:hypothetical protein